MRFSKNKGVFINLLKNAVRTGQNSTRGAKIRPSVAFSGDFCRARPVPRQVSGDTLHIRRCSRAFGNICAPDNFRAARFCGRFFAPRPADSRAGAFAARFYTRSGICAFPPHSIRLRRAAAGEYAGERKSDRQAAHGNCAGFFRRYIEIASANGYNRLKHMPAVRISAGVKFEKGRYYHENNPHPE